MTEYQKWVLELSNEKGVTPIGKYPTRALAITAMQEIAFNHGETLDNSDDSGNGEYVFDVQILDDDGEWIYDSESYIIRGVND